MTRILFIAFFTILVLAGCERSAPGTDEHGHGHGDEHADAAAEKGAHGGRVLEAQGHAVELGIAEAGTPPKFRAWLYRGGKPLHASAGGVEVSVTRLGGAVETFALTPQPDGSLLAAGVVGEPHSFDVEVRATIDGRALRWNYASYEGRTQIPAPVARDAGIVAAAAGPGVIADEHEVQGLLTTMEGRVATVTARFPGPIRELRANVGDTVRKGQTLAVVESNLSLSNYAIASPIGGTVLARSASLGGAAGEGAALFEVADLSSLWVDLHIFGADAQHITAGVPVTVTRMSDGVSAQTTIERVLPGTATASQSTVARAAIANADGLWRTGSAVRARITVQRQPASLVVPLSALQTFRDWDVVFVRVGDTYEVRPVELGMRDAERVEIRSGLNAGDAVVVEQSYVVKADVEKSGASHDH
ncbi:MAG TPA: efflux RND transporter periplasmic adaptor subunit [Tahibacter sp.]|uniref:efflux RND transporter periplasmic adaptor subunit n=1 Tax=Tahibacter sp. TaxID=2056211 RepID=UPI002BB121EE|nr:efflux RND transporter periplasmic adaptor subunit [Tahibacter sp.]HSX62598.1 efflux RND transporter periplasmic adaptor subunit [Tahibacter sp.]